MFILSYGPKIRGRSSSLIQLKCQKKPEQQIVLISGLDTVTSALSCYDVYECKSLILCNFEPDTTLLEALARFNPRATMGTPRTHYIPSSERTPIICLTNIEEKLNWNYERAVSFVECYFQTWNIPPSLSFLPADDGVNNLEDSFWTYIADIISSSGKAVIYTSDGEMSQEVLDGLYRKTVAARVVKSQADLAYDQKVKAVIISSDSTFFESDITPCGNVIIFHPAKSNEEYVHMHACARNFEKRSARIVEVVPSGQMNFVSLSGITTTIPIDIRDITPDLLAKVQHGHVPLPDEKDLRAAKYIQVSHGGAEQRLRTEVATIIQEVPKFADAVAQKQVDAYLSGGIKYKTAGTFGTTFFRQQQSYDSSSVQVRVISEEGSDTEPGDGLPLVEDVEKTAAEEFRNEDEYGRVATKQQDRGGNSNKQDRYRGKDYGWSRANRRPERGSWERGKKGQGWDKQRSPPRTYDSDDRQPPKQGWEEGRRRRSWNNQERPPLTYDSDNRRPPKQGWEGGRKREPWNNQEGTSSRSDASENGRSGLRNTGAHDQRSRKEGTSWSKSEHGK
ncbi:uncharacterized protein BT62DRAFT_115744 [Guyanagaster necrorhizus]|uniref:Uncharacterized protein n=1 Tax=Guyanagaster necrorhizus TaxID=856835 RepID=A0A9P7VTP8_9AGAR|nr:uncharacterized protein BT62DRAFT_115744 [Guyanagaster necrorhizus MCA 3950]KAG7446382.1 hypothetical protein BT62DRAFT_115744 [Guyanagaster necrorhizus MCA 3950]